MIKETILIEAETGKAQDEIKKIDDGVSKLNKNVDEFSKSSKDSFKSIEKSSKNTEEGVKGIGKAFKGVGTAIKAAGIGLLIAGLATLKDIFSENQKVADFFSTSFEVISIAFNDFANFIVNNTGTITKFFTDIFDNPLESIKGLGDVLTKYTIDVFKELLDTLGYVGEAVTKFFKGDFEGALESIKEAGIQSLDILTGVDDSARKIGGTIDKVSDAVSNYTDKVIKSAKENTELNKQAEIGAAKQAELVEIYDQQAEKLRQIRDNDLLTIQEREVANNKLLEVLKQQKQAMLEEADAQLKAAEAQFIKNGNQENEIALIEARTNKKGVEAQIEGFLSEQDANRVALKKESLDLTNSQAEADGLLKVSKMEANAELIENEYEKLLALKAVAEEEKLIQTQILEAKRNSYKEGTQAYQDANNELIAFTEENAQKQKEIERDLAASKTEETINALGTIAGIAGENSKFGKAVAVVQAVRDTYAGATKAFAQGGLFGAIGAAGIIASGLASVKKITATKDPALPSFASGGGGGGSSPSISIPTPSVKAPSFNIVGQGSTNQLADAIGSQEKKPLKAYVVSSDVSTAQALDRDIIESASF